MSPSLHPRPTSQPMMSNMAGARGATTSTTARSTPITRPTVTERLHSPITDGGTTSTHVSSVGATARGTHSGAVPGPPDSFTETRCRAEPKARPVSVSSSAPRHRSLPKTRLSVQPTLVMDTGWAVTSTSCVAPTASGWPFTTMCMPHVPLVRVGTSRAQTTVAGVTWTGVQRGASLPMEAWVAVKTKVFSRSWNPSKFSPIRVNSSPERHQGLAQLLTVRITGGSNGTTVMAKAFGVTPRSNATDTFHCPRLLKGALSAQVSSWGSTEYGVQTGRSPKPPTNSMSTRCRCSPRLCPCMVMRCPPVHATPDSELPPAHSM
mmetsp:Transcript_33317/g.59660  ORF Transcript_33317/g.59660 Transcript_33317/m.59660 type:complete len:320 (+) Transcript_33317:737-1696(+)